MELNHAWKLHSEPDLGVPLAPSAMDLEYCYVDPTKKEKKKQNDYDELFDEDEEEKNNKNEMPALHPNDLALFNWKGSMGDSVMEELQLNRDRTRAEERKQAMNGGKKPTPTASSTNSGIKVTTTRMSKGPTKSRVLDENNMKFTVKTIYTENDLTQQVHNFTSQAQEKDEKRKAIRKKYEEEQAGASQTDRISQSFISANKENTNDSHPNGSNGTTRKNQRRKHPNPKKRNVEAVYEIPLLPDVDTWGHDFTHLVMGNLPKKVKVNTAKLSDAYVADVSAPEIENTTRMKCSLLLPDQESVVDDSEKRLYNTSQYYSLEVEQKEQQHGSFLIMIDEDRKVATYHPIGSKIKLISGRPVNMDDEKTIKSRLVSKRELDEKEVEDMEMEIAKVDLDYAEKYGVGDYDDEKMLDEDKIYNNTENTDTVGDAASKRTPLGYADDDSSGSDDAGF